jgi:hypothetical protein
MKTWDSMPDFFTCFLHPAEVREENSIDEPCPHCGRPYSFPLSERPREIRGFQVIDDLGRGFYGATFLVESGSLRHREVLKAVPKAIYSFFDKDFASECLLHQEVAEATEHLVTIRDFFDEDVDFGGVVIRATSPCSSTSRACRWRSFSTTRRSSPRVPALKRPSTFSDCFRSLRRKSDFTTTFTRTTSASGSSLQVDAAQMLSTSRSAPSRSTSGHLGMRARVTLPRKVSGSEICTRLPLICWL